MCKAKVLAIIVTYNPEIIRLTECINSLAPQVERVILVDNGSNNSHLIKNIIINNLEIILLSENKGIAFAQNHGVTVSYTHLRAHETSRTESR
ncbi:glycosyltransferase, partial [Escherichia coli]|uniref:glycosyltransferase n=1 Tax=Escherichia coli TaxID=562 RepID=UPI00112F2238